MDASISTKDNGFVDYAISGIDSSHSMVVLR